MQQGMLRTFGRMMLRSGDQLLNLGYAAEYLRANPRLAS
jgi:hypothetical protein